MYIVVCILIWGHRLGFLLWILHCVDTFSHKEKAITVMWFSTFWHYLYRWDEKHSNPGENVFFLQLYNNDFDLKLLTVYCVRFCDSNRNKITVLYCSVQQERRDYQKLATWFWPCFCSLLEIVEYVPSAELYNEATGVLQLTAVLAKVFDCATAVLQFLPSNGSYYQINIQN